MFRSISLGLALIAVACFSGCSKKLYTHQQVMQGFRNKKDVEKRFGRPDIRRMIDSTEEWIYNHDLQAKAANPSKESVPVITDTLRKDSDTLKTGHSLTPSPGYISFLFDKDGNVIGYKSKGVDLSYQKKISAGTNILKALGTIAIIALAVGLDVYGNSDITF
jgi:hypothetical protein